MGSGQAGWRPEIGRLTGSDSLPRASRVCETGVWQAWAHGSSATSGWHLPGDLTITSGDIADGRPTSVAVVGDLFGDPVEGWQA